LEYSEANWLIREAEWAAKLEAAEKERAAAQQQVASLTVEVSHLQGQLGRTLLQLQAATAGSISNDPARAECPPRNAAAAVVAEAGACEDAAAADHASMGQPSAASTQQQQPPLVTRQQQQQLQQQQQPPQPRAGKRKRSLPASLTAEHEDRSSKARKTSEASAPLTAAADTELLPDLEALLEDDIIAGAQHHSTMLCLLKQNAVCDVTN
jgi:hypothetical protein